MGNDKNKASLINLLKRTLQDADVVVQQAPADADSFIVGTAIQEAANYEEVTIIGEDIDLLVLLTGLGRHLTNIFFKKPSRGRTPEQLYSPASFKYEEAIAEHILFLHAISGCDTTSCIFNVGKIRFFNALQKNKDLGEGLNLFKKQSVNKHILAAAGERILIALFGGGQDVKSLDTLRFKCFTKSVTKSKFNLATLPPTTAAAQQHIYRTYLQVQMWLEHETDATEWGWIKTHRGLEPISTTAAPAPESLLKTILCKCKMNCGKMCGCRKAGLKCSVLCHNCSGESCENVTQIRDLLEEDNDDDNDDGDIDNPAQSTFNADTPETGNFEVSEAETDDVDLAGPSSKKKRTK